MNIAKAYTNGFRLAGRNFKMIGVIYLTTTLVALLLMLPFFEIAARHSGHSLPLQLLLQEFDFMLITDFIREHEGRLMVLVSQVKWFVLFYLVLTAFLNGGILKTLNRKEEKFTLRNFFAACGNYFPRFMGLTIVLVVLHALVLVLVILGSMAIFQLLHSNFTTELAFYRLIITALSIYSLFFIIISLIGDYAKFYLLLYDSRRVLKGFGAGFRFTFRHILRTTTLLLLLWGIPLVLMYLYLNLSNDIGMQSAAGIIAVFVMQQLYFISRIYTRVWLLGSEFELYSTYYIKTEIVKRRKEERRNWEKKATQIAKKEENTTQTPAANNTTPQPKTTKPNPNKPTDSNKNPDTDNNLLELDF